MAKVQGKKAAGSAKKVAAKKPEARSAKAAAANRVKPAAKKAPAKPVAKKVTKKPGKAPAKAAKKPAPKKPSAKQAPKKGPAKPASKKAAAKPAPKKATPKAAPKKATQKPAPKKASATAGKSAPKAAPKALKAAKVVSKPEVKPAAKAAGKALVKAPAKTTAKVPAMIAVKPAKVEAVAKPVATPAAPARVSTKAAADNDKKRARRSRPRVQSNGAPVAAWLNAAEKPRPSSFIPAPARAEAPSLVAAPPASSDRLIRSEDLADLSVRTVPVRVDIEQGGGRVYLGINPEEVTLHVGEGIEWDFRYIGGADVTVDEVVIEFEKPAPVSQTSYRSRKPGTARPHRQHSGAAHASAAGKRFRYAIRAMTSFRTELAITHPFVNVVSKESAES